MELKVDRFWWMEFACFLLSWPPIHMGHPDFCKVCEFCLYRPMGMFILSSVTGGGVWNICPCSREKKESLGVEHCSYLWVPIDLDLGIWGERGCYRFTNYIYIVRFLTFCAPVNIFFDPLITYLYPSSSSRFG